MKRCAGVGSVSLELCGVFQQVFICQLSGCCCLALLKTSHGISWRCRGLDTTSHTYTCACVCLRHKSYDPQRYPSPKRVVTVKKYTCSIVCFEVWATLDLFAENWLLCVCSAAQAYNSPLCGQSGTMCFAVTCGVEVMTEGESLPAWRACHFVCVALPLCISAFLSPFPHLFVYLSVCLCWHSSLSLALIPHFYLSLCLACQSICLKLLSVLSCYLSSPFYLSSPSPAVSPLLNWRHPLLLSSSVSSASCCLPLCIVQEHFMKWRRYHVCA